MSLIQAFTRPCSILENIFSGKDLWLTDTISSNHVKRVFCISLAPFLAAPVPMAPNQKISLDIIAPIKNVHFLLPIVDHFSCHMELYYVTIITAPSITKALLNYISTHDRPEIVLCDQGKQLTSDLFNYIHKLLGIRLRHSTTFHLQANGLSEHLNPQIKSFKITMASHSLDNITAAKVHQSIYNVTVHPVTKFSPNFLHFDREISDIYSIIKINKHGKLMRANQDIVNLTKNFHKVFSDAYSNNKNNRQDMHAKFCVNRKYPNIKVGDTVYIKF